mmetsp:Transcript_72925/g.142724  ORF Transcript_72925/g.142724 Transcript_72925/m.142724 type:complete len:90 (+) Transcript_72925:445-714(+)
MFTLCWPRADYLWFPCDFRAVAYFFVLIAGSIVAFSLSPGVSNLQNRGPPNSSFTVDILSQGAQCCHGGGLPVECDGNGSHASESDEQR